MLAILLCCCPFLLPLVSGLRSLIGILWQSVSFSYNYYTVPSVLGMNHPASTLIDANVAVFINSLPPEHFIRFSLRIGFVQAICSPSEELPEDVFLCFLFLDFLSLYLRLKLSNSIVPSTSCNFSGPLINLSHAFVSFIMAANLYVIISSCVILLNSHFLPISRSCFQYSLSVSLSSSLILKNWSLLWNTFLVGRKVFLNKFYNSCRLMSFNSLPHWPLMISCFAFGPMP